MTEFCIKAYFKARNFFYDLTHKENGDTNIIAIILVLLVVVILAMAFRKNIAALFNNTWKAIKTALEGKGDSNATPSVEFNTNVGFIRPFLW